MEFLPYPHLIATLFNGCACGPPLPLTAASAWTWIDHPVSGLRPLTERPVQTRFPFGSVPVALNLARNRNSPDRSTKSTRSTYPMGSVFHSLKTQGFRFSFTPLPGSFSPFLHSTMRYRSLRVFSLGGWSPLLPTGFPVSRGTLVPSGQVCISRTGLSPSLAEFPKLLPLYVPDTF